MIHSPFCKNLECRRAFTPTAELPEHCSSECAVRARRSSAPRAIEPSRRPKVRGDCLPSAMNPPDEWKLGRNADGLERVLITRRSCPFVGCRHHLFSERAVRGVFSFRVFLEAKQTCALDLADAGSQTFEQTADALLITRKAVEFILDSAIHKAAREVARRAKKQGVTVFDILPERESYPPPEPAPLDDEQEQAEYEAPELDPFDDGSGEEVQ